MNETNTSPERVRALEAENAELRRQLNDKQAVDEDLYAYRIFVEARRKLTVWITSAAVILAIFGIYSFNDMVNQVKSQVDKQGTDHVIEAIKERIYTEHEGKLKAQLEERIVDLVNGQTPVIVAKLEDSIRAERPTQAATPVTTVPSPGDEALPSRPEGLYYVVAGSSPEKKDLEREKKRVRDEVGREFDQLFPNVQIYPPLGRNTNFALVVDGNLPQAEAEKLRQLAIQEGFRSDTFLWKASKVSFKTETD